MEAKNLTILLTKEKNMSKYYLIIDYKPWNLRERNYKKFATTKRIGKDLNRLWEEFLRDNDLDLETKICKQITTKMEQWDIRVEYGDNSQLRLQDG